MRPSFAALLVLGVALLAPPAGTAAPFTEPVPVVGADAPAGGAAVDDAGSSVLAVTVSDGDRARAALVFGSPGKPPTRVRRFGPPGAYDLELATNREGVSALTFSVDNRAYLTICDGDACGRTRRIARTPLKPESTVAVEPQTGRTTVMWRGSSGAGGRLQWRITTGGRLGRPHTLGEFGDRPRLATDRSGKSVAIWRDAADRTLRTAARRKGEFTRPTSLTRAPVAEQQLAVADNRFVAAWLTAAGGIDAQDPAGTVQASTRYDDSAFLAPQSLGEGSTVDIDAAPGGRALLTVLQVSAESRVVASTAGPSSRFTPLRAVDTAGFASTARPPRGALDDAGHLAVAYSRQRSLGQPAEVLVVRGDDAGFGEPERVSDPGAGTGVATVDVAAGAGVLQVAFSDRGGVRVRRAPLG